MRPTSTSMTQTDRIGVVIRIRAVSTRSPNSSPIPIVSSWEAKLPNTAENRMLVFPVITAALRRTTVCDSSKIAMVMSNVWVTR